MAYVGCWPAGISPFRSMWNGSRRTCACGDTVRPDLLAFFIAAAQVFKGLSTMQWCSTCRWHVMRCKRMKHEMRAMWRRHHVARRELAVCIAGRRGYQYKAVRTCARSGRRLNTSLKTDKELHHAL